MQEQTKYRGFFRYLKGDSVIWAVTLLLATVSILTVYSATSSLAYRKMLGNTEHYLLKHTLLIALSLGAMWLAHHIDYRYYAGLAKVGLWASVPLLLLTWRYGLTLNEASRWLTIPFINKAFQPSDLAQLALIIRLSALLAKRQQHIQDAKTTLLPLLAWCGLISGLIALSNLSAALLLLGTCMLLLFMGRVPLKQLALLALVGLLAGALAMRMGQRGTTAWSRISTFMQGELPFQTEQSYIAIATGGFYGKGPGNSQQRNVLPHPYSDFIYAILVEEYGLFGGMVVALLYLILLLRSLRHIRRDTSVYGGLLAAGLGSSLALQAMTNMAVAVGLGPVTGLQLPFLSMGGTSLLFTGIALGIILSVSRGELDESLRRGQWGQSYNTYKSRPRARMQ